MWAYSFHCKTVSIYHAGILPKLKSKETHVSGLHVVSPVPGASVVSKVSADSSVEANGTFAD